MRKRRRLANKLTIMVCAVLVAVSAFFYAPMDVEAQVSWDLLPEVLEDEMQYPDVKARSVDISGSPLNRYFLNLNRAESEEYDFTSYINQGDGLYIIEFDIDTTFESSNTSCYFRNLNCYLNMSEQYQQLSLGSSGPSGSATFSAHRKFYVSSDSPTMRISYKGCYIYTSDPGTVTATCSYNISNITCSKLETGDADAYQNGYNAGYAEGETAGYGNGYSQGFADGEASVDTDAIYDEAFQAGKDSVDTQSYYDAGYDAGYQAAYSEGYESGYDVGYQSAMDRIGNWGADTTDYPVLVCSGNYTDRYISATVTSESFGHVYGDFMLRFTNTFNPFHVYKLELNVKDVYFSCDDTGSADYASTTNSYLTCLLGSNTYVLDVYDSWTAEIYIPGDQISNIFVLRANFLTSAWFDDNDGGSWPLAYLECTFSELDLKLYDMGPSGDTQNHIANQTDQLTNGFDESQGNSVNSDLSSGLNEYQTAEDSLWATATTGLKDFTFFDFESVPAMITGMSFITSIMGSWFSHAGGASGVGIVLSILFSVMLVAMVLGLYRLYQSKGGKK